MKKIFIILLIFIVLYYYVNDGKAKENLTNIRKCCLVSKVFDDGKFSYTYKSLKDDDCNYDNHELDSNRQLYIEDENNWSNDNCVDNNYLGSCRNINFECTDFISKEICDKYKMTWSKKTCHDPLEFVWKDRVKVELPKINPNKTEFKMF